MSKISDEIKILYIEDDSDVREELAEILEMFFKNVYCGKNGKEGLELYNSIKPDVIISDVQMPIMNGLDMIKEIKKTDSEIFTIITTAFSDAEYLYKAIEIGIDGYEIKPIDANKLLKRVNDFALKISQAKELKKTQTLLEEYKEAVDESALVSKTDKNGIITYANKAFCKLSGYSKEELLGQPQSIIRHPDVDKEVFRELWEVILNKQVWKGTVKNRAKDGRAYYVDVVINPILDENGEIQEFMAIRKDITELHEYRELLENQLNEKNESLDDKLNLLKQYEDAIEKSTAFARTDTNGVITYVNNYFCKVTGFDREDLIGKTHKVVQHPEESISKQNKYRDLWKTIQRGEVWSGTFKNQTKNKEEFYLNSRIVPIKDRDGHIIEFMGISQNITKIINLQKEIEETQEEIVYRLGEISETRSKETGLHVKRVAAYSGLLARAYGLDEDDCRKIVLAAPMHDVGKIGIPDEILNKPGKLTQEEFEIMKTHATLGYNMFKDSNREILKVAATIANEHHEKYNGQGYPNGLAGEDIHIFGRIVAIADVFDALGHDRCYKKAWDLEKILELLEREKGEHFDPILIDLFFENIEEVKKIQQRYNELS